MNRARFSPAEKASESFSTLRHAFSAFGFFCRLIYFPIRPVSADFYIDSGAAAAGYSDLSLPFPVLTLCHDESNGIERSKHSKIV